MSFQIISVSICASLTFRHYIHQYVNHVNIRHYEQRAAEARRAILNIAPVASVLDVKVAAGVVVKIIGVAS